MSVVTTTTALQRVEEILRPLGLEEIARDTLIGFRNGFMDRLDSEALTEESAGNQRNADAIYTAMDNITRALS